MPTFLMLKIKPIQHKVFQTTNHFNIPMMWRMIKTIYLILIFYSKVLKTVSCVFYYIFMYTAYVSLLCTKTSKLIPNTISKNKMQQKHAIDSRTFQFLSWVECMIILVWLKAHEASKANFSYWSPPSIIWLTVNKNTGRPRISQLRLKYSTSV